MVFLVFLLICLAAAGIYAILAPTLTLGAVLGVFALSWLAVNLLFALTFTVNALLLPRLAPGEGIQKQHAFSRWLCIVVPQWLGGYCGVRPKISGREKMPDGPFLFICNHRSMFDPLVVMAWMGEYNISFVSKPSNLRIPIAGITARHVGFLAIDRENNREALKTILQAADYLKRGVCNIGIYPEGTRSHTGELLPFHKGSFKAAQRANVPLAIACIQGSEKLKHGLLLHPHDVTLTILELVPAEKVKAMNTAELADYARDRIQECLDGGKAE